MDEQQVDGGKDILDGVQGAVPIGGAAVKTSQSFDSLHNASDLLVEYLTDEPDKPMPTGLEALDKAIGGGFRHKGLYIIAGRTGEGKTSLVLSLARRMALENKAAVLYLSLEMSKKELIERVICQATLTPLKELEQMVLQGIATNHITKFQKQLRKAWFHIEDMKHADILSLDALWQEFKDLERKPDVLVIDHLQMVKFKTAQHISRADAISEYMAELKQFCKKRNVITLVCCQINRDGKEKPSITNLKGSGGIEENADIVMIGSRVGYDKAQPSTEVSADCDYDLWIAKHRRGPESKISLTFRPPCFEFLEPTSYGEPRHPSTSTIVVDDEDDKDVQIKF